MTDAFVEECTVSGVLYYVLRASQFHAVVSLNFHKVGNEWRIRVPDTAWLFGRIHLVLIFIVMMILAFVDSYIDFGTLIPLPLTMGSVEEFATFITVLAILIVETYTASDRMYNVVICLSQLQKINSELIKCGPRKSFWKTEVFLAISSPFIGYLSVISSYFLHSLILMKTLETYVLKIVYNGFWYWISITSKILFLQMSILLVHVLCSFNHLNDCLTVLKDQVANNSLHSKSELSRQENIHHQIPTSTLNTNFSTFGNNQVLISAANSTEMRGLASRPSVPGRLKRTVVQEAHSHTNIIKRESNENKETVEKLQILAHLYFCLQEVVHVMDESHGMILMFFMVYTCLLVITTPYYFIMTPFHFGAISVAITQVLWMLYPVSDLLMILEPCHRTHMQMRRTRQLVSTMIRLCSPEDTALMAELKLFCKSLIREEVSYSPMAVFRMDRPLLLSVLATVVTYLVILIQL